jgi:hypothetical protein
MPFEKIDRFEVVMENPAMSENYGFASVSLSRFGTLFQRQLSIEI